LPLTDSLSLSPCSISASSPAQAVVEEPALSDKPVSKLIQGEQSANQAAKSKSLCKIVETLSLKKTSQPAENSATSSASLHQISDKPPSPEVSSSENATVKTAINEKSTVLSCSILNRETASKKIIRSTSLSTKLSNVTCETNPTTVNDTQCAAKDKSTPNKKTSTNNNSKDCEFRFNLLKRKKRSLSLKGLKYGFKELVEFYNFVHNANKVPPREESQWSSLSAIDDKEYDPTFLISLKIKKVSLNFSFLFHFSILSF
jgi:hypothetical protein